MRTTGNVLLVLGMIVVAGCGDQETAEDLAGDACERLQEEGEEAGLEPVEERRREADVLFADFQRAVEEQCPDVAPFGPDADADARAPSPDDEDA